MEDGSRNYNGRDQIVITTNGDETLAEETSGKSIRLLGIKSNGGFKEDKCSIVGCVPHELTSYHPLNRIFSWEALLYLCNIKPLDTHEK